jgi:hypothetical protein
LSGSIRIYQESEIINWAIVGILTATDFDALHGAVAGYLFGSGATKLFQLRSGGSTHDLILVGRTLASNNASCRQHVCGMSQAGHNPADAAGSLFSH